MAWSPSKTTDTPFTISALLNSLHSHLQVQTQSLPTLHAQLGLPPSALADELSSLHHQLTNCVEQQIDGRRKEVESWMARCDGVEKDCLKYVKALGAHTKATGASVGELRKQQVLPVRHEMLSQYQEKLDQLYRTKLEQLTTLTNRIIALSRTLGPDFYSADVLDHALAQADDRDDEFAKCDVTPERFSRLEKELVRGKSEITRRLTQLSATLMQMDWLYGELDIAPPTCDEPASLSSSLTVPSVHSSLSRSTSNSDLFSSSMMSTPTPASRTIGNSPFCLFTSADDVSEYHRIYALFILRIDEADAEGKAVEPGSLIGVEGMEPTVGLMTWAEQTKAGLEDIKKRRETHIQAMYDQLEILWKRLSIEDQDIDGFMEANCGSSEACVKAYEAELERMLDLKRERMSVFIENARTEIEGLWDDLMVGDEERADFVPFVDDEHTEELLLIHENEIKNLKEERRLKAPLLAGIRKYFDICEEERELAASATDQGRLLGRGPRDPGRLLREEKMRKRVKREKPRLEHELLTALGAWEDENGKEFFVNGVRMLETLMVTVHAADKENARKNTRAGSVPPRATTPANGMSRVVTGTGTVTPAVRPGPSMAHHSAPAKRQRLGPSSNTNGIAGYRNGTTCYEQPQPQSGRMPLGNRAQVLNDPAGWNPTPTTSSKKPNSSGKTPNGVSSSLPRPVSATRLHVPPVPAMPVHVPRSGSSYAPGIGLGHAGSLKEYSQARCASAASYTSGHMQTSVRTTSRNFRNNRRESFKPRPSVDGWTGIDHGAGGGRWAGMIGISVKEEDEF